MYLAIIVLILGKKKMLDKIYQLHLKKTCHKNNP